MRLNFMSALAIIKYIAVNKLRIGESVMKEISMHVGQRIRLYRKMKNLTIETFAKMIGKSKATVSKYENGDIAIDIETLFMIAEGLGVSVNQLIDYQLQPAEEETAEGGGGIGGKDIYYMYFYDGRRNRIARNVIEVQGSEGSVLDATMYLNVSDLSHYYQCSILYHGTLRRHDTVLNFQFENQNNKVERAFLCAINSFRHNGKTAGLCCGLSTQPILPACFKFVLSPDILEENAELKAELTISKDDIKALKKMNMFVIGEQT